MFDIDKVIIKLIQQNKTYFDGIAAGNEVVTNQLVKSEDIVSACRILKRQKLFFGTFDEKKESLLNWLIQ